MLNQQKSYSEQPQQMQYQKPQQKPPQTPQKNFIYLPSGAGGDPSAYSSCAGFITGRMGLGSGCPYGSKCTFLHACVCSGDAIIPLNWKLTHFHRINNLNIRVCNGHGGMKEGNRTCIRWFKGDLCKGTCNFTHKCIQYEDGTRVPIKTQWEHILILNTYLF